MRKIAHIAASVFALILISASVYPPENMRTDSIGIDILSKYIQQVKEGSIPSLVLMFPYPAVMENRTEKTISRCSRIEIRYKESFVFSVDGQMPALPSDIAVSPDGGRKIFTVMIPGETGQRVYPLACRIHFEAQNVRIVIYEDIMQYADDSARSEYGALPSSAEEAEAALAMIIRTRAVQQMRRPIHREAVFCDLAHCQTYKGRTKDTTEHERMAAINEKTVKDRLFFSSSCGGETLSNAVFGGEGFSAGIADRIIVEDLWLCRNDASQWKQRLPAGEAAEILGIEKTAADAVSFVYDRPRGRVFVRAAEKKFSFAAEDFRLKVNRVKGWNFLKSNNYTLTAVSGNLVFDGYGLGHGVGFCQKGAVQLAQRGFSRYEILEHYYPGIGFISADAGGKTAPDYSYCTFSIKTGNVQSISYNAMLKRRQPAGSFFKLITSAYLLTRRPDLASSYQYICTGKSSGGVLPEKCDKDTGHGRADIARALPCSCNLFYSSLYDQIDEKDFRDFVRALCGEFGLTIKLPPATDKRAYASLLAGLDFRTMMSVKDGMELVRIIASDEIKNEYSDRGLDLLPPACRKQLREMLADTFIFGTAAGQPDAKKDPSVWGKTSTVIFGTNNPHMYGSFLGGCNDAGIICILNKGYGYEAAAEGRRIIKPE